MAIIEAVVGEKIMEIGVIKKILSLNLQCVVDNDNEISPQIIRIGRTRNCARKTRRDAFQMGSAKLQKNVFLDHLKRSKSLFSFALHFESIDSQQSNQVRTTFMSLHYVHIQHHSLSRGVTVSCHIISFPDLSQLLRPWNSQDYPLIHYLSLSLSL